MAADLAGPDPAIVESVRAAGYPRLVERFRHRGEDGDAIARGPGPMRLSDAGATAVLKGDLGCAGLA